LVAALWPLAAGHLFAMLLVILPFALLVALVEWQRQIQIGASLLVIGFGVFRLVDRRHPRSLARIRPTQLGLWSFAVAIAHGTAACSAGGERASTTTPRPCGRLNRSWLLTDFPGNGVFTRPRPTTDIEHFCPSVSSFTDPRHAHAVTKTFAAR
jgi:hypothetical protein